jgi:hypothetical protein
MTQPSSVLDKALALRAEASRLREGQAAQAEAQRVAQRLDKTLALLGGLRQAVTAARRLQELESAPPIDLSCADDGRDRFARHAAGLPSDQAFTAAQQKIKAATTRINDSLASSWSQWAQQQLASLPLVRITMLTTQPQEAARKRSDELQKLARQPPTAADIEIFIQGRDLLREALADVLDPPPEVLDLIHRLAQRPWLTLGDLTDEQISLLRVVRIADQIELRRRGM